MTEATASAPIADQPDPTPAADVSGTAPEKGGEGGRGGDSASTAPALPPLPPSPAPDRKIPLWAQQGDDIFTPAPDTNPVLEALRQTGLYREAQGHRSHSLTCPWAHEHEEGADEAAIYFEPIPSEPAGGFRCDAVHAERRHVGHLLDHLGVSPTRARCRPVIRQVSGEMNRVVASAEWVLAQTGRYYQVGGAIYTIRSNASSKSVWTEPVSEQALTAELGAIADWEKYDGRTRKYSRCDPPARIVQLLLKAQDFGFLPHLNGIARQPYIRRSDRTLVHAPGYDPVSMDYGVFNRADYPLPEPTEAAAREALEKLKGLLEEFHFESAADRSAALCAMLTAANRNAIGTAPAFSITASTPGSGKSYLASVITPFAGTGEPLRISYPTNSDEATKAMLSALMQKPAVILFDDMQTEWIPHGVMNRMLTSETISDRVLGASRTATVNTRSFFLGTGNNVSPLRDMSRRVVTIRLTPPSDSPATLSYRGRPAAEVERHRGRYVALALTIVRAWLAAGSPRSDVPSIGGFEDWSDLCRQPLIWLGESDPAISLVTQIRSDPDAEALGRLFEAWHKEFGAKAMMLRTVINAAEDDRTSDLHEALMDLPVVERGYVNRSKLGWFLKRNESRVVAGFQLLKSPKTERNAWAVLRLSRPKPTDLLPSPPEAPQTDD